MMNRLREAARRLKREIVALAIAARDPRTPLYAKAFALFVVAYALSPVDLIPDFIPVLGLLDDVILVPLGIWVALRLIPADLMQDARAKAEAAERLPKNKWAGAVIVAIWIGALALAAWGLADALRGEAS
ncbi:MAG: YkvA family protein [Beijerinckiaceae bacterium]|jgi:uncharacterized membrane protein YkvA (DUF1232 family)